MSTTIERKVKAIFCLADSTFTVLLFQFPADPTGDTAEVDPAAPIAAVFPMFHEIGYVASFKLATGTIQVVYESNA